MTRYSVTVTNAAGTSGEVVEVEVWLVALGHHVAGRGNDVRICNERSVVRSFSPAHVELGDRFTLEPLHHNQVNG